MATPLFFVKLALTDLSPTELIERGRAHVIALTGNADFPTPNPTTAAITAAADALEVAEAAVLNNGGRQDYLTRNERMQELRNLLTLLGSYVQVTSGGDPEKIASTGFEVEKEARPIGPLPAPRNLSATAGDLRGVIDLRWDSVKGRLIYELEMRQVAVLPESWQRLALLGRNRFAAEGLTSGTEYAFRVRAIGAAGPSPDSDIAVERPR